jgi:hypothetical protein
VTDRLSEAARFDRLAPIVVAALAFGMAAWLAAPYAVGVFHDDGVYAILAKSIATGQGYRFLHLPGAPAATHYPPGYPLVLALLWRFAPSFPANVPVFLFANAGFLGATAAGTYQLARRVFAWDGRAAVLVAIAATLSLPLMMLSGIILSEPFFVALLLPALIAAERLARDDAPSATLRASVGVGLLLGALVLVRTHGIALVAGLLCVLALRRRWRTTMLCATGAAALIVPWQLWLATHGGALEASLRGSYGPYGAWLLAGARGGGGRFLLDTVILNAREVGALMADRFALSDQRAVRDATAAAVAAIACAGLWSARRRAPVTVAFTIAYFLILLAWPYTPWRFLYAAWPLVVIFIGDALRAAVARAAIGPPRLLRFAGAGAFALVALGAVRDESRAYRQRAWQRPAAAAAAQITPLVRWVSATTRPGDVVAVDGEQLVYLFTGRKALPIAPFTAAEYVRPRTVEENAAALARLLAEYPVRFVATISPALRRSAALLADVAPPPAVHGAHRLVFVQPLADGGAFRVEEP